MKVIYVAGPFRSKNTDGQTNAWGVHNNVISAMALALEVWKLGHAAICPHANTIFFDNADGCADDVWLLGDIEILNRCDALVLTSGWERSTGAKLEAEHARASGIPVFYDLETLKVWLV